MALEGEKGKSKETVGVKKRRDMEKGGRDLETLLLSQ